MKLLAVYFFTVFICAQLFGQGVNKYRTDTTVNLINNESYYSFDFDGGVQGFYWGENYQIELKSNVVFSIKNSSEQEIIVDKVEAGDQTLQFKSFGDQSMLVAPNDSFKIVATIKSHAEHIEVPLVIHYTRSNIQSRLVIQTWQKEQRTNKLRVYHQGTDLSRNCKVYIKNGSQWILAEVNDKEKGYHFFNISAVQDAALPIKIEHDEYGVVEATLFTSRGANGYISHEIAPSFRDSRPAGLQLRSLGLVPNTYCLLTKMESSFKISKEHSYMDSIQKILNKSPIQSFDKDLMILTINGIEKAYALDQKLRKSGLGAKLLPICYDKLLHDAITVFFTEGTSAERIEEIFAALGIENYTAYGSTETEFAAFGKAKKYIFVFNSVIGTEYQDQLEALWNMPQVKFLKQDTLRNPYLPPVLD